MGSFVRSRPGNSTVNGSGSGVTHEKARKARCRRNVGDRCDVAIPSTHSVRDCSLGDTSSAASAADPWEGLL
jgi:hypothetical protein